MCTSTLPRWHRFSLVFACFHASFMARQGNQGLEVPRNERRHCDSLVRDLPEEPLKVAIPRSCEHHHAHSCDITIWGGSKNSGTPKQSMFISRSILDGYKLILTSLLASMGISTNQQRIHFFAGYLRLALIWIFHQNNQRFCRGTFMTMETRKYNNAWRLMS